MNQKSGGNSTGKSELLHERARQVLPGGVSRNTIFRKPWPSYADFGKGCRVTDVDGVERIDFANNMASLIHGHAHPAIIEAVQKQLQRGTAFTMATEAELLFAETMCKRVDWFDQIRFVNSGTEAVMVAIKSSRAITGKPMIAKCEGAYHGTYDYAEVSQKSQPDNWGEEQSPSSVPVAKGTPQAALNDVLILPFNDVQRCLDLLNQHAEKIACILIDPLPHRIGLIPATSQFMKAMRKWTQENSSLLVLDEVITFRMGFRGAADWFDVRADLTAMGKIIGGGFPVGALAGSTEVMSVLNPERDELPLPHSGTFSANPITMTAGRVAMELFDEAAVKKLNELGQFARVEISQMISESGFPVCITGAGSMFRIHPKTDPPTGYRSAYQNAEEMQKIKQLVDHLYDDGFMMINTCSAALSTTTSEVEVRALVDSLQRGLAKVYR